MLLRHTIAYLFARGIPGMANFLALALYTRLLSPEEYGHYAMAVAAVALANAVLFQWLRLGLLRFLPAHASNREAVLSTVFVGFWSLVGGTALLGGAALLLLADPVLHGLVALGIGLLWVEAWLELNLTLARSQLAPKRYGLLAMAKAVLSLTLGGLLAYLGLGAPGLMVGVALGTLLPAAWATARDWRGLRLSLVDKELVRQLVRYGLPLTAIFALNFVISSSDRFLLGWLQGSAAAGVYAVGYDLTQQSIGMLMMVVNLAAYPLAIQALEKSGEKAARSQLAQNVTLLFMIGLPSTVGLAVLAPSIAGVVVGSAFREASIALIPWVAVGAFLACARSYHLDLAFQLSRHTVGQVWVALSAAVVNFGLNMWWIPTLGFMGAAYATVVAYAVAFGVSLFLGRRVFPMPLPAKELCKVMLAVVGMGGILWPLRGALGVGMLVVQIACGLLVYGVLILVLNVASVRDKVYQMLRERFKL
jgi:O-antigen/teichoic acid export membrane protein